MIALKGGLGSSDLDGIKFAWSRRCVWWLELLVWETFSWSWISYSDRDLRQEILHPRGNTVDIQRHLVAMRNVKELNLDELGNVIQ